MKKTLCVLAAVGLLLSVASVALAGDEKADKKAAGTTIEGTMMCAKCTLSEAGLKDCQDVVVVKDEAKGEQRYYIVKNTVSKEFGHMCKQSKDVKVTGVVADKDGKTWIDAQTIVVVEKKG